ncbi:MULTISPECIES: helix-turn-helix transcriptional regulator [Stenotrophomonas]|uniref:helix-turn-helix transcriptional regulator n=1 Tax=Stenotrophomonas TaxID=40323 RepID=UPI0018D2F20C|nr:AlpA family phage regulatory protein [Stenotrophomonas sp.]MBH1508730.1 AlpA family phage regulatory protein [Stenotrophomonas maltophilia]
MKISTNNDSATQSDDVLIPLAKVEKKCGFSKTSICRMMNRRTFPKPAKRAGRSVRWRNSEVQQWVRNEWPAQARAQVPSEMYAPSRHQM